MSGTVSAISRNRSSLRLNSSSARLRSVMSMLAPMIRSGRPDLSRITLPREIIQRTSPDRIMRNSYENGFCSARAPCVCRSTQSLSSGCKDLRHSPSTLAEAGSPEKLVELGRQVSFPVAMSHSQVPIPQLPA